LKFYKPVNHRIIHRFLELANIGGWAGLWKYWWDSECRNQNGLEQRCDIRKWGCRWRNLHDME